jgi:tetratricopeptide (TPR) repeat protein
LQADSIPPEAFMQPSIESPQNVRRALQLIRDNKLPEAVKVLEQELSSNPKNPDALHLMGIAAYQTGLFQSAINLIESAIRIRPQESGYYNDCGEAYRRTGNLGAAIARFRRALALDPGCLAAHNNLGSVLLEEGKIEQAITSFRHVLQTDPQNADAHYNLSLALLLTGNFTEGWKEYEWRWESAQRLTKRDFSAPLWDGSRQADRTVLIYCEQGLGDTLQFIRYIPSVQARVGNVIVECGKELTRLLKCIPGISLVERGQSASGFDLQLPILSLPRVFGATADNVPARIPYLFCESEIAEHWQNQVGTRKGFKVGIVWAGNKNHVNDHNRSCPFEALEPLFQIPGIQYFSLQKRDAQDSPLPDFNGSLIDCSRELNDFADTAGLISALDLVISVDTAVVHLAGALAKPVWTLLPLVPDWRWMLGRNDSPWYPTMRLFRQSASMNWPPLINQVADELAAVRERVSAALTDGRSFD